MATTTTALTVAHTTAAAIRRLLPHLVQVDHHDPRPGLYGLAIDFVQVATGANDMLTVPEHRGQGIASQVQSLEESLDRLRDCRLSLSAKYTVFKNNVCNGLNFGKCTAIYQVSRARKDTR